MRRIRKAQQDRFHARAGESFEARAILHLRRDLRQVTEKHTDQELRERIYACKPRAKTYGFHAEAQLICFIDVTFLLGERFDIDPIHAWCRQILLSEKLLAQDKANLLLATAFSVLRGMQRSGSI